MSGLLSFPGASLASSILPRGLTHTLGGFAAELALDATAFSFESAAELYARTGLAFTKVVSGMREVRVAKRLSERDKGEPPYYLKKRDHFISTSDHEADLMLGEICLDRETFVDDGLHLTRGGDYPVIFYSHGMFMNSNFGLFPIDGRGPVPNIDTIRTFLGFFAYLGFRVYYLHMRNCVHIQNRYVRNRSSYVTNPSLRPDLKGVHYQIPQNTTFDVMRDHDVGSALRYLVERRGHGRIVAMAHSLGGDILYDYLGQGRPCSENIAGFVPLCSPLRWKFDNEELFRILIRINKSASSINDFLEEMGSDRRTNPLGFAGERIRTASEIMAGFSPAVGFMYQVGARLPLIRDALKALRNTDDKSEHVDPRTIGKFIRKCLEPMPERMILHFMRIVESETGALTSDGGKRISDNFPNIKIPVLAVAGERDGLADPARHIAPDFGLLGSERKRMHVVKNGDHFTTVAGKKSPRATWFEIARWMHEMGFYPDYDAGALEMIYRRHLFPAK